MTGRSGRKDTSYVFSPIWGRLDCYGNWKRRGARASSSCSLAAPSVKAAEKSIWDAPDVGEYRSVLLKIGGDGLATVLAHDLKSEKVWTRVDALQRAIWNPTEAVRQAVREVAARDQHEEAEQFFLMKVLASFEEDETFAEILRRGVPLYQDAFDIRHTKSPVPAAIGDRACADALSGDEPRQLAGLAMLSLCKGDEVAQCLQTVLASNDPTSAVARSAVLALDEINYVSEETIRLITPMMHCHEQQRVVFTYLLRRGAQAGEAVIAKYFAAHDRNEVTILKSRRHVSLLHAKNRPGRRQNFCGTSSNNGNLRMATLKTSWR